MLGYGIIYQPQDYDCDYDNPEDANIYLGGRYNDKYYQMVCISIYAVRYHFDTDI